MKVRVGAAEMRSTDSKPENFNDAFKHSIAFFLAFPKERVKPNHLLGWMMQIKACKNQIGSSRAESQSKNISQGSKRVRIFFYPEIDFILHTELRAY